MKAKPVKVNPNPDENGYIQCEVEEATHIELKMPCPLENRIIPVITSGSRDECDRYVWSWNGDTEKPTLHPSVKTEGGVYSEDFSKYDKYLCHTWIKDGEAQFLSDCTHEFANQTILLNDVLDD